MTESFRRDFDAARAEFGRNRSVTVAALDVVARSLGDLNSRYAQLVELSCLLCRLHYLEHAAVDFPLQARLFPLRGIRPISIAASLMLFARTNHKDRFAVLIAYLRGSPDAFAQIAYLACVMQANRAVSWPGHHIFTEDDITFFCFSTFPAVFNFFLAQKDQNQAIDFIEKSFLFHLAVNGPSFLKQHQFLTFYVSSFFLAANPGAAFEFAVPLIRQLVRRTADVAGAYEAVEDGSLVRTKYWELCVIFAGAIVRELRRGIPLIPNSIRLLVKRLSQVDAPKFPFLKFLIFDAMFVNYIEHFLMDEYQKERRDICQALRAGYPATFFGNRLSKVLAKPIAAHPLGILLFWTRLQAADLELDSLSLGIASCEQISLFCPRDLALVFHGVDLFLRYGNGEGAAELVVKFAGLSPPENEGTEKIMSIRNWGVAPKGPDPIPSVPHGFAELFSVLTVIDSAALRYSNPQELADRALLYGGLFLNGGEKVMLSHVPNSFAEISDALTASASHSAVVQKFSLTIFDALFHIGHEIERNRAQSLHLLELHIRKNVIRGLQEAHPFEFALDGWSTVSSHERTAQFLRAVECHIAPLQLPPEHNSLLQRALILGYIDEIELQSSAQILPWNLKLHSAFMALAQDHRSHRFGLAPAILDRIRLSLAMVGVRERASANLRFVLHAMSFLAGATPDDVRGVIASVGNPAILSFVVFILPFATDRAVVAVLFEDAGVLPLQLFIMAGNALRAEIGIDPARSVALSTGRAKKRK